MLENVHAASRYTEAFDGGLNGWLKFSGQINVSYSATGGNPGGCLMITGLAGPPQPNSLGANGSGASSNIIGNYSNEDILLLGFDVWSASINTNNNALTIGLEGTNNLVMRRDLSSPFPASNTWYSYRLSLNKSDLSGWYLNEESVDQIRENVTRFEMKINFDIISSVKYDNIFIDALPACGNAGLSNNLPRLAWNNLRTNEVYRLEHTTDLAEGIWSTVGVVTAQTATITTDVVLTNQAQYFRMVME